MRLGINWNKVREELRNWRQWNWKRIIMQSILFAPLTLFVLLSIDLGLTLFLSGWVEINTVPAIIAKSSNSTSSLEQLSLVNESALLLGVGLILMQIGILTWFYTFPKVEEWIEKKTLV